MAHENIKKSFKTNLFESVKAMLIGFVFLVPVLWLCVYLITTENAYSSFMSVVSYLDFIAIIFFLIGVPFELYSRTRNQGSSKSI